jgi:hypothetical protein
MPLVSRITLIGLALIMMFFLVSVVFAQTATDIPLVSPTPDATIQALQAQVQALSTQAGVAIIQQALAEQALRVQIEESALRLERDYGMEMLRTTVIVGAIGAAFFAVIGFLGIRWGIDATARYKEQLKAFTQKNADALTTLEAQLRARRDNILMRSDASGTLIHLPDIEDGRNLGERLKSYDIKRIRYYQPGSLISIQPQYGVVVALPKNAQDIEEMVDFWTHQKRDSNMIGIIFLTKSQIPNATNIVSRHDLATIVNSDLRLIGDIIAMTRILTPKPAQGNEG